MTRPVEESFSMQILETITGIAQVGECTKYYALYINYGIKFSWFSKILKYLIKITD